METRIEVNVITGEQKEIPLNEEELLELEALRVTHNEMVAAKQLIANEKNITKQQAVFQYLVSHTPQECAAWVNTNVTDLASAKDLLSKYAMILCILAKREFR